MNTVDEIPCLYCGHPQGPHIILAQYHANHDDALLDQLPSLLERIEQCNRTLASCPGYFSSDRDLSRQLALAQSLERP